MILYVNEYIMIWVFSMLMPLKCQIIMIKTRPLASPLTAALIDR